MTCDDVQGRLDDYVDGELPEAEFHEVELHLGGCAACRDEERLVRAVVSHARALPREMTPPRDLWPGIAERIAPAPRAVVLFPRRPAWGTWIGLAAAAAALVALGMALGGRGGPMGGPREARGAASPSATASLRPAAASDSPLLDAEGDYERATQALLATLQERRESLAPETLKNVEEHLAVIDKALDEVRVALRQDPGNRELTRMLVATHRKKVEVLRRVVRFSTEL